MFDRVRKHSRLLIVCFLLPSTIWCAVRAQAVDEAAAVDADEEREGQAAQRFLRVLEKNPRRGTALDRVATFHGERGKLDELLRRYRAVAGGNVEETLDSGTAWMIIGLLESQRGQEGVAGEAFRAAEKLRATDSMPAFYLGQSLTAIGQLDEAAAAYERALEHKPTSPDALEIFQALGRVHQRAQRTDEALRAWGRLENLFPGDLRVQQQIAAALVEEEQWEAALLWFESLAAKSPDRYQQAQFRLEAADIKRRLGRDADARADLEQLVGQLNPDNWLFREARRRIEEPFARNDDFAGLVKYYEQWLAKHADDLDAMARLARGLARQRRFADARQWLDKAIALAPSRKDLRLQLIEQLVAVNNFGRAIEQYAALDKLEPNNSDFLREWGRLILKDTLLPEAERRAKAAAIWRRMIVARPNDPVPVVQVADLLRQHEMRDEAQREYERAVELAPDAPQYREYLGEFFHRQKRRDEALAAWRQIAAPGRDTAANLARLAEVLANFGYHAEALAANVAALVRDPRNLALHIKQADWLTHVDRHADALESLRAADVLAESEEEKEAVLKRRMAAYEATQALDRRIAELREQIAKQGAVPTAADRKARERFAGPWYELARCCEVAGRLLEAVQAIERARQFADHSTPILATAARLLEARNELRPAIELFTKLTAVDRRFRSRYLIKIAELEAKLGRNEFAMQAGRDALAAAPGNPETVEFFARLCFDLRRIDEGLQTLRRAARGSPADSRLLLALATALADHGQEDEAIATYWRAFDQAADVENRLPVLDRLTQFYLQRGQRTQLFDRLERLRRDPNQARDAAICLAHTYLAIHQPAEARAELLRLYSPETTNVPLLRQLVKLSETLRDVPAAIGYQQHMVRIAPGRENESYLYQLLVAAGQLDDAVELLVRMALDEREMGQLVRTLDSLLAASQFQVVNEVIEQLRPQHPQDWELLYRQCVALASYDSEAARRRFADLLKLNLPDDDQGASRRATGAAQPKNEATPTTLAAAARSAAGLPMDVPSNQFNAASQFAGVQSTRGRTVLRTPWMPANFGQARLATWAWFFKLATDQNRVDEFLAEQRERWRQARRDRRVAWDWYYLQLVRDDGWETFEAARELTQTFPGDVAAARAFLDAVPNRRMKMAEPPSELLPLPSDELQLLLAGGRVAGLADNRVLSILIAELRRAKREDWLDVVYREALAAVHEAESGLIALRMAVEREDVVGAIQMWRLRDATPKPIPMQWPAGAQSIRGNYEAIDGWSLSLDQLIDKRARAGATDDVLRLLDAALTFAPQPARVTGSVISPNARQIAMRNALEIEREYPVANGYIDPAQIAVLRFVSRSRATTNLPQVKLHFEERANDVAAPLQDRVLWRLALAYLRWWERDHASAVRELSRAIELAPGDADLRFELATMHELSGDRAAAFAAAAAIVPANLELARQQELLVLRLAKGVGELDRGRLAAERLLAMKLDTNTELVIAMRARELGLSELSDKILASTARQPRSDLNRLTIAMHQFQAQGNEAMAREVARLIAERLQAASGASSASQRAAAAQAAAVLGSGQPKTPQMRSEREELLTNPKSLASLRRLAQIYAASGETEKRVEVFREIAAKFPDDPAARLEAGLALSQTGDAEAGFGHIRAALKLDATLLRRSFSDVLRVYQKAGKLNDLAQLVDNLDWTAKILDSTQYVAISELIAPLLAVEANRAAGLRLLRRSLATSPGGPLLALARLRSNSTWELPEVFELAREVLVPVDQPVEWTWNKANVWISPEGRIDNAASRVLEAAARHGRLDVLAAQVDSAAKREGASPQARMYCGLVAARRGDFDAARRWLAPLISEAVAPLSAFDRWLAGQELAAHRETDELAASFLFSITDIEYERLGEHQLDRHPARRLIQAWIKADRKAEGRDLLLRMSRAQPHSADEPNLAAFHRVLNCLTIATQLSELGELGNAARVLHDVLSEPDAFERAARIGGAHFRKQAEEALARTLQELPARDVPALLGKLLEPAANDMPRPICDRVSVVHPQSLSQVRLASRLTSLIEKAASDPQLLAATAVVAADWQRRHPDDVTIGVAAALVALAGPDRDAAARAVANLDALVARTALPEPQPDEPPTSPARQLAERQIALWFVAARCHEVPALHAAGDRLAQRAIEAAVRHGDQRFVFAVLWERLESALVEPGARRAGTSLTQLSLEVMTLPNSPERVAVGLQVAKLAARAGRLSLSSKCVIDTLAVVPQSAAVSVRVVAAQKPSAPVLVTGNTYAGSWPQPANAARKSVSPAERYPNVLADVVALIELWQQQGASDEEIYKTLAAIVLPPEQPAAVALFQSRRVDEQGNAPANLGVLLVRFAEKVGRLDELRRAAQRRLGQGPDGVAARALLTQIAVAKGEASVTEAQLAELPTWLRADDSPVATSLAIDALTIALQLPELSSDLMPPVEAAVAMLMARGGPARDAVVEELPLLIARHYFRQNNPDAARRQLEHYVQLQFAIVSRKTGGISDDPPRAVLLRAAAEFATGGQWSLAIGKLEQYSAVGGDGPRRVAALAELLQRIEQRVATGSAESRAELEPRLKRLRAQPGWSAT